MTARHAQWGAGGTSKTELGQTQSLGRHNGDGVPGDGGGRLIAFGEQKDGEAYCNSRKHRG